jgi:SAM-dependent methyltransferase
MTDPALTSLLREISTAAFQERCASANKLPLEEVARRIDIYTGEIATGLALLDGLELRGKRVLEVGAGLGLLSIHLKQQGINVTALEPGSGGFDFNATTGKLIRDQTGVDGLPVWDCPAEDLTPDTHGQFDVIFSSNVLEHIPQMDIALKAMLAVLKPDGVMIHTCPNYRIPYEPHYGLPLVPFAPRATVGLMPSLKKDDLWRSLNFVTYGDIVRFCRTNDASVSFDRELLHQAFKRLDGEAVFRDRQPGYLRATLSILKRLRLLDLLKFVGPSWSTPMRFRITYASKQHR